MEYVYPFIGIFILFFLFVAIGYYKKQKDKSYKLPLKMTDNFVAYMPIGKVNLKTVFLSLCTSVPKNCSQEKFFRLLKRNNLVFDSEAIPDKTISNNKEEMLKKGDGIFYLCVNDSGGISFIHQYFEGCSVESSSPFSRKFYEEVIDFDSKKFFMITPEILRN